ncbi:MAG: NADH-ubiquinone oxidoreductase-F iron-sulfur binding region domain-containing protein [Candidatus Magnetobacterium sp. LHC-1]|nr:4Fe-4S binding protein [Nitrospirota bacterium]
MPKLTIEDLNRIKETYDDPLKGHTKYTATLCGGSGCRAKGSLKVKDAIEKQATAKGGDGLLSIHLTGCNGFCAQGPVMKVYPGGILYQGIKEQDATAIVDEHLTGDKPVEKLLCKDNTDPKGKATIASVEDVPFYKLQSQRVLRNRGFIDPDNINEYIAKDGYMALVKAVTQMTPQEVLRAIKDSGLKGRGGGGFPTGLKWGLAAGTYAARKFVVCNAGPISRSIVEIDPNLIIEGMVIAARAIGATQGYVYVREPDNLFIINRLKTTLAKAREYGFIGENILNSGFDFDIELSMGAGTFICGEETAMISSMEGRRGYPTSKPPYPAYRGLWGYPTAVDNAETFANAPQIILNGPEWFRRLGTTDSPGTKLFTLTGEVNTNGLIEVDMGITFKSIVFDIGGGMKKKKRFKALGIGGSTGGFIPEGMLDIQATYEDIVNAGTIMGSGNLIVMDHNSCMVNTAMFAMEFATAESCGKCVPCRVGTKVMYDKLVQITEGFGEMKDIETLEALATEVKRTSLCGFGQTNPLAVLTTIKYFAQEYVSHIRDKWCKTGRCKKLSTFYIDHSVCTGCTSCARKCPQSAITGEKKTPHTVNQALCVQCRSCFETCTFGAVKIGARNMFETQEVKA